MIVYVHDCKTILTEPLKSRSEHEMLQAMKKIHEHLKQQVLVLQIQILDNKCPAALNLFATNNIK